MIPLDPHHISLATKTWSPIHRDDPSHYVSTIHIDILYGDELENIGEGKVYEVRMDQIVNDGDWSLFAVFDSHSSDLSNLYEELFVDDELISDIEDELCDYDNVVLIKSIVLKPEYRGQGLGGILALAIAERFGERDIVALKPWPMNPDDKENSTEVWELPRLVESEQKSVATKLRKSYCNAGFKPLFKGSKHLFLTHLRHPTAMQLIDKWNKTIRQSADYE
jgi:GNAT superfamily N-acetyltransferase